MWQDAHNKINGTIAGKIQSADAIVYKSLTNLVFVNIVNTKYSCPVVDMKATAIFASME